LQLFALRGGWRDGRAGVVVCGLMAWYTFLKDSKLWEMQNSRVNVEQSGTHKIAA